MPDLLSLALENNMNVSACPIHEYWMDVGQPETLSKAKNIGIKKFQGRKYEFYIAYTYL